MPNSFRSFKSRDRRPLHVIPHVMPSPAEVPADAVCGEFSNLGDAVGFPPEALNPNAAIDRVVLALALVCNDLNDAVSIVSRMDEGASGATGPTPYDGARTGRRGWATRLIASITHEALDTLKAHEALLSSHDEVRETLTTMTDANVAAWSALMVLALEPGKEPRRQFLVRVRNNVSYHYADAKSLAAGYQRVFVEQEKTVFNRWAYVSAGGTYSGLRFYFADAAAAEAVQAAAARATEDSRMQLTEVAAMTINGLFNFVLKFMDMRVAKLMAASS